MLNHSPIPGSSGAENPDKALKMLESAAEQRPEEGFIVDSSG